ncbi:hypothetical protein C1H46_043647 [Malus baccata]|uniref:SNARE-complex protein Syntaxin-18 N-terminal domain-containing protein n=1 Tax=Malus baccata TaxID=106549 RepID=A0A540K9I2_MALBA|nr:hypothetical protein C1H46_043647 [Malus baccata]
MSKVRDRIEDFKDAVRHSAISMSYNESKLAAIMAKFIIHAPRQRSPFTRAALKTLESIGTLEQFMLKHRKDYVDLHRTTEQERDSIEHEVLILSERLHSVTSRFDQLRAIRIQDSINKATPRRKLKRIKTTESADTSNSNNLELREPNEFQPEPLTVQQQLLDDETHALQVELTVLLDAVQETETKMAEMSALNHLMSTHVLQQAHQIEQLYDQVSDYVSVQLFTIGPAALNCRYSFRKANCLCSIQQAVEATTNVEFGNKEISKAIQRNSSSRTFLLLFLFVLTFSILFLDWYS